MLTDSVLRDIMDAVDRAARSGGLRPQRVDLKQLLPIQRCFWAKHTDTLLLVCACMHRCEAAGFAGAAPRRAVRDQVLQKQGRSTPNSHVPQSEGQTCALFTDHVAKDGRHCLASQLTLCLVRPVQEPDGADGGCEGDLGRDRRGGQRRCRAGRHLPLGAALKSVRPAAGPAQVGNGIPAVLL
jgi:hypothetical protein